MVAFSYNLYTFVMMRIDYFGKYIKEIRGNIRQKDFAESLGISQNHLSNLETGRREPTISLLLLIFQKYGVSPSYWFEEETPSKEGGCTSVDSNLKAIAQCANAFDDLKFSEIHSIISQLYVYLDTRKEPLPPSDRRMLSDILAACQRIMDCHEHPRPREQEIIKVINN